MTHNDILRRLRYILDISDTRMMDIFALGGLKLSRARISEMLKKEDDPSRSPCTDRELAVFLNGLIVDRRGRREGPPPETENRLNHNIIFRKLKIAFDLKAEDVLEILDLADFRLSKHELSAFFRKEGHKHYRVCHDQVLRNFLTGLQLKYRPAASS